MRNSDEYLDQQFNKLMPCNKCPLSSICKYNNSIKRPNYNYQVFDLKITCKIKEQTIDSIVDNSKNSIPIGVE